MLQNGHKQTVYELLSIITLDTEKPFNKKETPFAVNIVQKHGCAPAPPRWTKVWPILLFLTQAAYSVYTE